MNPVTFRNMNASEQERYAYLSDLSCVEARGALIDLEQEVEMLQYRLNNCECDE